MVIILFGWSVCLSVYLLREFVYILMLFTLPHRPPTLHTHTASLSAQVFLDVWPYAGAWSALLIEKTHLFTLLVSCCAQLLC